jgi:hypothetical protein
MAPDTGRSSCSGPMHAGAGTGLALVQLSALTPGLLPTLALLAVLTAVVVLPLVALTLVVGVVAIPPLGVWLLARRIRAGRVQLRRRSPAPHATAAPVLPNPTRNRA